MGDDENLSDGIRHLLEGRPIKHGCENCGDEGMAPAVGLPVGWKYVMVSDRLVDDLDEVDRKTIMVCAICYGLMTRVVKKLPAD